jgi:hypothetical protein
MTRRHLLLIRGQRHEWQLPVYADPKHVADWRADGIEIHESVGRVPTWLAWAARPIMAVQRAWQWLRLW